MCVVTALAALPAVFTGLGGLTVGVGSVLADIGLGLGIASMFQQNKATNYQADAARNQQVAQNQAIDYNSQVLQNNAEIADMQAQDATNRGEVEVTNLRRKASRLEGRQRALAGASGAVADTGSPLDVMIDSAKEVESDALTLRHNAAVEAWGHRVQSTDIQNQAQLNNLRKVDPEVPYQTTVLGGKSKLYDRAGGLVSSVGRFAF